MLPDRPIGEDIASVQRLLSSGRDDRTDCTIACAIVSFLMEAGFLNVSRLKGGATRCLLHEAMSDPTQKRDEIRNEAICSSLCLTKNLALFLQRISLSAVS